MFQGRPYRSGCSNSGVRVECMFPADARQYTEQRGTLAVPTLWISIPLAGVRGKMWMHPATVAIVEILRQHGADFIGPEKGMLACGYEGIGRLWPVDVIVAKALEYKKR
jgi:hypothetical protein